MAKIVLQSNASGNGTLTITAPSTNTDFTLNIPAESGSLLTSTNLSEINVASNTLVVNSTAVVVNENGGNVDFRVEGDTNSNLLFVDASAEAVAIGTGTASSSYGQLTVGGTGITIADDNNAKLQIGRYSSGVAHSYIKMGSNSNSLRVTNPADSADILTLTSNGDLYISGGVYLGGTAGPTGNPNNYLDDYEEGTWTPVIESGSAGTGRVTTAYSATYTKIGNLVFVQTYCSLTTIGTGGSALWYIKNLPFATSASDYYATMSVSYFYGLASNINFLTGTIQPGTTEILFRGTTGVATGTTNLTFSTFVQQGTAVIISGCYHVA